MTTELNFVKQKGMSHLLTKRAADCTEDERRYKRAYARYIKQRYIARKSPENYSAYNSNYNKQYYQLHKDKLREQARQRMATQRGESATGSRGRKNLSGITFTTVKSLTT